jgi:hypothetical protein
MNYFNDNKDFGISTFNKAIIKDFFRTYLFKVVMGDGFECHWISNTQTPIVNTSAQVVDYMHTQIKVGGKTLPQQWQITVRDDADGKAFAYFNNWRREIYPIMTGTLPGRYKKDINLILISPKIVTPQRNYIIRGVWPMEIGNIQLDYESDNISTFPITLSFDYYDIAGVGE